MKKKVHVHDGLLCRIRATQRQMKEIDMELNQSNAHQACIKARENWIRAQRGKGKLRSLMHMALHKETISASIFALKSQLAGDKEGSSGLIGQICPEYQTYLNAYESRAQARMNEERFREAEQTQQMALLELIARYRNTGKKTVVFMAPYFSRERLSDGYFQRVQAVDSLLGEDLLAVYCSWLDADEENGLWKCCVWDARHIEISFPRWDEAAWSRVREIAHAAGVVYHHSVTFADERITRDASLVKIVDLHGAYPEELRMYGRNWRADLDEVQERIAICNAQKIICVSRAMETHIREKYPGCLGNACIVMPILKPALLAQMDISKPFNGTYEVIYAGGMQRWQCVNEMRQAMMQAKVRCHYHICTSEPQVFLNGFKNGKAPKDMMVESVPPQQMKTAYMTAHFGFVLRKDCTINRVSCPTKLMEYIALGIVPILDSIQLGDFVAEGMRYISLADFIQGKLPTPQEREKMVHANRDVLMGMARTYSQGVEKLRELMTDQMAARPKV